METVLMSESLTQPPTSGNVLRKEDFFYIYRGEGVIEGRHRSDFFFGLRSQLVSY
jgi:hypothetical protein